MTDKQLDELLKREMAPDEQPPELPKAAPRAPKRSPWMGLAAACLCFAVSAAVFLSMDFGLKGADRAAPESAFDRVYAGSSKADAVNGAGDIFCDTVLDAVTEESENKSTAGITAIPETETPSSEPSEVPESPEVPDAPTAPSAVPEKPTSSELDRAINDFLASLPYDHDNSVPLITHVGSTEQYLSMMVTTDTAIGYFTTDRSTGAVVSLSELLTDESLEKISLTHPEEEKLAQEEIFYVNRVGQVVIYRMPDAEFSPPEEEFHESYGNLNLATLLDLSARYGENLNWDTFDPYFCEETAGEIYTMKFPVNSELYLLVAGDRDAAPEVVRLVLKADPDIFVDMRTGNVKEFLKKNDIK